MRIANAISTPLGEPSQPGLQIPPDRRAMAALLGHATRFRGYRLQVETDLRGEAVADLQRRPVRTVRK